METKTYYTIVAVLALATWITTNLFVAVIFIAAAVAARHFWISFEVSITKASNGIHVEWTENGRRERFTIKI